MPLILVPELWMEYPAMWEFLKEEVKPKVTQPRFRKKFFASRGVDGHDDARMDAEEAVEALVRRRAEMGGEDEEEWRKHFRVTIRGGYRKWSASVHGCGFELRHAYVIKNSDADRFLQMYGMNKVGW